jgi:hypothetical protein
MVDKDWDVPPVTDADLPPLRQSPYGRKTIFPSTIMLISISLIFGVVYMGLGISNVIHANDIASHGVQVRAVVLSRDLGFGRTGPSHILQVGYTTAAGQHEQGQLAAPNAASSYRVGSAITVVYDPFSPWVVTMPKAGSLGPWVEVVMGIVCLLVFPLLLLWNLARTRKRHSQVLASKVTG